MAFCGECGTKLDEGMRFCPDCGTAVPEPEPAIRFCGMCGTQLEADARFCPNCGAPVDEPLQVDVHEEEGVVVIDAQPLAQKAAPAHAAHAAPEAEPETEAEEEEGAFNVPLPSLEQIDTVLNTLQSEIDTERARLMP